MGFIWFISPLFSSTRAPWAAAHLDLAEDPPREEKRGGDTGRGKKTNLHFGVLALSLHVLNLFLDPLTKFRRTERNAHKRRVSIPGLSYCLIYPLVLTTNLSIPPASTPSYEKQRSEGGAGPQRRDRRNVHFFLDKLQPSVYGQHGLATVLLQEHGTDQFVNVRGRVERGEFLLLCVRTSTGLLSTFLRLDDETKRRRRGARTGWGEGKGV